VSQLFGKTQLLDMPEAQTSTPSVQTNTQHLIDSSLSSQVLSGKTDVVDTPENVNWVSRAMLVYRQAVSQGLRPSLKALDRLLACLRLPYIHPLPSDGMPTTVLSAFKVGDGFSQHQSQSWSDVIQGWCVV